MSAGRPDHRGDRAATHPWLPSSPCGPGCRAGGEPSVGWPRAAARLAAAGGVLLIAVAAVPMLTLLPPLRERRPVRWAFRGLLRAFGVRLAVSGVAALRAGRGALVVNNHVSWLDILAINAVRPMCALAKREVRGWPVLGGLATVCGSVYVDRDRLRSLPGTVAELASVLRSGSMVNVTPEGTTWCGLARGRFRAAAFQAAIDGGVGVVPVALRFRMAGGARTTAPSFVGEDTLVDSLLRVARLRGLVLEVCVLEELPPGCAAGRRELAALADAAIGAALDRDSAAISATAAVDGWTSSELEGAS